MPYQAATDRLVAARGTRDRGRSRDRSGTSTIWIAANVVGLAAGALLIGIERAATRGTPSTPAPVIAREH